MSQKNDAACWYCSRVAIGDRDELRLDEFVVGPVQPMQCRKDARLEEVGHVPSW
jgi:hypothetical protein